MNKNIKQCPITTILTRVWEGKLNIADAKLYLDAIYRKEGK